MKKFILLVCFITFFKPSYSGKSDSIVFRNLALEGGGIKGIAFCGAIQELENRGIIKNIDKVVGSSSGAINALLIAIGYNAEEITQIIYNTEFNKFNDGKFFVSGIHRMFRHYGYYKGKKINKFIARLIEAKTGNSDLTFKQLHDLKKEKNYKDLYITATNLTQQKFIIFSYEKYPYMRLCDAIRASISIPFYFQAVFIDSLGYVHQNPKHKNDLDILIDGGTLYNFPLTLFDSLRYINNINRYHLQKNDSLHFKNPETLGIKLDKESQYINDIEKKQGLAPYPIYNIKDFIIAFYDIMNENINRKYIDEEDWKRIIIINTYNIGPKIKHMSDKDKKLLIESGRNAVNEFLNKEE